MSTVEVKAAELIGAALDWAVAQVEGIKVQISSSLGGVTSCWMVAKPKQCWQPSKRWRQAGPLIEKHSVIITYHNAPDRTPLACTHAMAPAYENGDTVLVAACRAIVAAKLGDTVHVPAELL